MTSFLRGLWGKPGAPPSSANAPPQMGSGTLRPQHPMGSSVNTLSRFGGLRASNELRLSWHQYCQCQPGDTEKKTYFLDQILRSFVTAFSTSSDREFLQETFGDLNRFCTTVVSRFIHDVEELASTHMHSAPDVMRFLSKPASPTEERTGLGWEQLGCLEVLLCGLSLLDVASDYSLPTTLVKTLYFFLSLPPSETD
ncbi:hypothetical protein PAPYR_8399 [Paratrimastix pyriformis]|uniref:Uncharacterized protein n=1 Tax=Paratrimastix pyriformis TaxID=342808 RepID=A0ABQ8UHR9_9EUKA|nr:hypothetical protein PAPYR_8399 [Paratrimastix pyriformis]